MLKAIEKAFNVAMLFYTTGAVLSFVFKFSDGPVSDEGKLPYFIVQTAFYGGVFCFIAMRWRLFLRGAWNAKLILALVVIAVASSLWSQDSFLTLHRSIVMLATTAYGVYFGSRFTITEQLRLLSWTFALVALSSLFMVIVLPQYGVDHGIFFGAWQGAFNQKNGLARAMVLAALVFYFVRPETGRWFRWIGLVTSLGLLIASRSVTGAILIILMIAAFLLFRLARLNLTFVVPAIIGIGMILIALAFLIWTYQSQLLALAGKDPTLTGRTVLWSAVLVSILRHPWLGYGFDAFWAGMHGPSSSVLLSVGWYVKFSHNGFLDLSLQLGLLGLATFVVGYLILSKRALQIVRRVPGPTAYWLCAFLCLMVLYNLDESSIMIRNNIFWVLYTATAVNIATCVRERLSSKGLVFHYEF
jgi:O-antigen ligase